MGLMSISPSNLSVKEQKIAPIQSLRHFTADIKIAHSIFALPFAVVGLLIGGIEMPSLKQAAIAVLCMVSARSFAMGMNRFLDRNLDAENSRTINRGIPSGRLSPAAWLTWSLAFGVIFVASAALLSPLAGWLAAPVLAILAFYSMMKKISWITHWYLGICLGLAPIAVNIAFSGKAAPAVLFLGAAVMFWTAGFDIIYSLQDREFDKSKGFNSVPAAFGASRALTISRFSFVGMIVCLLISGSLIAAGKIYYMGIGVVAAILFFEQFLVRNIAANLDHIKIEGAFFTANAWVSVLFYCFVQWDYLTR